MLYFHLSPEHLVAMCRTVFGPTGPHTSQETAGSSKGRQSVAAQLPASSSFKLCAALHLPSEHTVAACRTVFGPTGPHTSQETSGSSKGRQSVARAAELVLTAAHNRLELCWIVQHPLLLFCAPC